MEKKLLAVDVDCVVVDSAYSWYRWLEDVTKAGFDYEWISQWYDFSIPYGPIWKHKNIGGTPFDYWRAKGIYDNLEPMEGCVDALEEASKDFDIVFISQHKGDHGKSKYYFLDKYFPFKEAVMLTKEKYVMNSAVVAMIDDRKSQLKGFDLDKRILFKTPHMQDVECDVFTTLNGWDLNEFKGLIEALKAH